MYPYLVTFKLSNIRRVQRTEVVKGEMSVNIHCKAPCVWGGGGGGEGGAPDSNTHINIIQTMTEYDHYHKRNVTLSFILYKCVLGASVSIRAPPNKEISQTLHNYSHVSLNL